MFRKGVSNQPSQLGQETWGYKGRGCGGCGGFCGCCVCCLLLYTVNPIQAYVAVAIGHAPGTWPALRGVFAYSLETKYQGECGG